MSPIADVPCNTCSTCVVMVFFKVQENKKIVQLNNKQYIAIINVHLKYFALLIMDACRFTNVHKWISS